MLKAYERNKKVQKSLLNYIFMLFYLFSQFFNSFSMCVIIGIKLAYAHIYSEQVLKVDPWIVHIPITIYYSL